MCRGCDIDTGPGWGELWAISGRDDRAFQKHRQNATLQKMLAPYPVTCRELDGGDSFSIASLTGRSQVVHGVRHIWEAVAGMTGSPVDVLDAAVIERAESDT